jgi:hypothetical protein
MEKYVCEFIRNHKGWPRTWGSVILMALMELGLEGFFKHLFHLIYVLYQSMGMVWFG